jgi:polyhydroxyalkanoate synthesis regulator phasin
MSALEDRLLKVLRDPKVAALLQDPRVQTALVRALRFRGRVEAEVNRRLDRAANRLNLATQKDVRALHRRIRQLERELREAQEKLSGDPDSP